MVVGVDELPPEDEVPPPEAEASFDADLEPVVAPRPARRRLQIAITLVVVASLVVVFGLNMNGGPVQTGSPAGATFRPTSQPVVSQRLAVVDANGGLSSMNEDGGSVVTYAPGGATFAFPAWSPDGKQIAAISTSDAGTGVTVFNVPVGEGPAAAATVAYQSPDEPPFYLYWAPDGRTIAFLATVIDGIALRAVPADGSRGVVKIRDGSPMYWQWIDASRMLVHSGGNATNAFVGDVTLDGQASPPATDRAGLFRAPVLSANGAYEAFAAGNSQGSASVVIEPRDGATHHEVPVFGVSAFEFDPAGTTLAFLAAASADAAADLPLGPLRAVDAVSGTVRTLLSGPVVGFFWAPDGRTIAALRVGEPTAAPVAGMADPVTVLARAEEPTRIGAVSRAAAASAPGIPLDLVFVDPSSGNVRSERTVRVSDLFINQVLPFFDQYALSHRFWSADSASIVLPLDDDQGVSRVTVLPADGSEAKVVSAGAIGFWSP